MNARSYRDGFAHRKLDVYRLATEFFKSAYELSKRLPRSEGFMKTQFLRAALSIQLNIAEGSGELRPREKARFYRIARRSADECSALLEDIEYVLKLRPEELEPYFQQLQVITVMLIGLDRSMTARARSQKRKPKK